ncbi:MAG: acetyltransferase, partial [Gammaproteobacteria bacterium]|nr:acetyltransferase [Gammaproteobacteria bacterium]
MSLYDVFNGDADGICALHQYRLANPAESTLITGVKRDIQLLKQIKAKAGDSIRVFDISFDKNRSAALDILQAGADIEYFDHHFCGEVPEHEQLEIHIDTSAETCTSFIVNQYLQEKHWQWAVVGCFGDGFDDLARKLAE